MPARRSQTSPAISLSFGPLTAQYARSHYAEEFWLLKETSKVIDAFTEVVCEDVAQGHEVRLMGFGTWNLREVAARNVKSIRGGKQITIPARKRVGFSVGAVLSQAAQPGKLTARTRTTRPSHPLNKTGKNGLKK